MAGGLCKIGRSHERINDCAVFIPNVMDQGRGAYGSPPHDFQVLSCGVIRTPDLDAWDHCALAAMSIRSATASGRETMTTWDALSITTVFFEWARSAMKAMAAGGMFLSAVP